MTDREKRVLKALENLVSDAAERLKEAQDRGYHWDFCNHISTAQSAFETALAAARDALEGK